MMVREFAANTSARIAFFFLCLIAPPGVRAEDPRFVDLEAIVASSTESASIANRLARHACEGRYDELTVLLDEGADPNDVADHGWPPLLLASQMGHEKIVAALLTAGAVVDASRADGWSALFGASGLHSEIVRQLLEAGANPNQRYEDGRTPLFFALANDQSETTKRLLAHGADSNIGSSHGWTPLIFSLYLQDIESASEMLGRGADPNAKIKELKWTALHQAIRVDEEAVKLLLAADAEVDAREKGGRTPLYLAVLEERRDLVDLLLKEGANPNRGLRTGGLTPLALSIQGDDVYIAATLLKYGAEVNKMIEDGWTPLMIAVARGDIQSTCVLLAHDASVEVKNVHGQTAIDVAREEGREDLADKLSNYAAKGD